MARASRASQSQREDLRPINPNTGLPRRIEVPREIRTVTVDRNAPQIKLSGAWLTRLGFSSGARFIVIADDTNQILLAAIDA